MKNILQKHKHLVLLFFLISFSVISQFNILSLNLDINNEKSFDYENLKLNDQEISIDTPENKTYTKPMSGYYPGSFSFDNDLPGSNPDGFTTTEPTGTYVQVLSELDGHKNVVEINDQNNAAGYPGIKQYSFFPRTYGTIELWLRFNSTTGVLALVSRDTSGDVVALNLRVEAGKWKYRVSGISYNVPNVADPQANTWYHIRIDFRCQGAPSYLGISEDRYVATINGTSSGELEHGNAGMADYQFFDVGTTDTAEMKTWVDAIGFSWDPNYNVGDNLNEGILLSYDTAFSPDWQAYSTDGASNKTILGNTSIPFPSDGDYTIQVFANDSIGRNYLSEVRHFSIDTIYPTISITSPSPDDFIGNTAPNFDITITEVNLDTSWYTIDGGVPSINFTGTTGTINQTEWDKKGDGPVTIRFYAIDYAGNENFTEIIVNKDTTPPSTLLSFIAHGVPDIVNESTVFTLTSNDGSGSGVSVIRYKINDSSWVTYTAPFTLANYAYGDILISYQAVDLVDNYETTQTLVVHRTDTIAPTSLISFTPYSNPDIVIKSTAFSITANDDQFGSGISIIRYKVNNSIWFDYIGPFDLSSYDYGEYTITYQAIDVEGNIETEHGISVILAPEPSDPGIPGYPLYVMIGVISIVTVILIKKKFK